MGGSYLSDLCSMYQKDKFFTGFVPDELLTMRVSYSRYRRKKR